MRAFILAIAVLCYAPAMARDHGQWEDHSPEVREWFRSLRQPDNPQGICCGESDGYWCDEIHVRNGETYCTINDDRPDEPLHRPHIDVGTEIIIPSRKIGNYPGNPTGHNIVFLAPSYYEGRLLGYSVHCYVMGGGV
jgi:hypothetical protein